MNLIQFLVFVAGGGSVIAASWILERSKKFQALSKEGKKYVFFGVSTILALSAWAIANFVPVDFLVKLAPEFTIISGTFAYTFLGKKFNENDDSQGKTPLP